MKEREDDFHNSGNRKYSQAARRTGTARMGTSRIGRCLSPRFRRSSRRSVRPVRKIAPQRPSPPHEADRCVGHKQLPRRRYCLAGSRAFYQHGTAHRYLRPHRLSGHARPRSPRPYPVARPGLQGIHPQIRRGSSAQSRTNCRRPPARHRRTRPLRPDERLRDSPAGYCHRPNAGGPHRGPGPVQSVVKPDFTQHRTDPRRRKHQTGAAGAVGIGSLLRGHHSAATAPNHRPT